jgi:hypothetical protein
MLTIRPLLYQGHPLRVPLLENLEDAEAKQICDGVGSVRRMFAVGQVRVGEPVGVQSGDET